ncbi:MAG: ATP-binding protein [Planctomycetota bacterium]
MTKTDPHSGQATALRQRAEEEITAREAGESEVFSLEETQHAIHELRVHQIELEMQNDELRKAHAELEAAKARYFDLYDLAPVGYCTLSEQGLILEANLTAATLLGTTRNKLVNQPLSHFIFSEDVDAYYLCRKQIFATDERQTHELRMVRANDAIFWVRLEGTAARNADGKPGCRLTISDISEHKRAEDDVKAAQDALLVQQRREQQRLKKLNRELNSRNRDLNDFVLVATHDLRAPLVNIQGFIDTLASDCNQARAAVANIPNAKTLQGMLLPLLDGDILESVGYIRDNSRKMDTLLTGLLKISRIGKAALSIQKLDMNPMLAEIVLAKQFSIEQAGATVQVEDLPACRGDAIQINQIFSNLLDNALKYLDPSRPGVIRVSGGKRRKGVVYCVEDNGVGIGQENHALIFKAFHRLSPLEGIGQGLGLTIVRRILDQQHGKIWLESTPGQGSKFFVSLQGP